MTTIMERMNTALGTLDPAVPFAVSPYKGDLPNHFITYQLLPSPAQAHADNRETERNYSVQVSIWNNAAFPVETNVDSAVLAAGFMKGDVRQVPQDPQTHHYGLAIEYFYLETKE